VHSLDKELKLTAKMHGEHNVKYSEGVREYGAAVDIWA
jgi:hypothetical protein